MIGNLILNLSQMVFKSIIWTLKLRDTELPQWKLGDFDINQKSKIYTGPIKTKAKVPPATKDKADQMLEDAEPTLA